MNEPLVIGDVFFSHTKKKLLENVSFVVEPSQIALVKGPNGSGKTTVLHLAAGFLQPAKGFIRRPALISWYAVGENVYLDLTVEENLAFFSGLYRSSDSITKFLVDSLGLDACINRRVRHLSHGQRVKVGLLRSLMVEAPLYLWDEPFNGLDSDSLENLMILLKKYREKGASFLMATHSGGGSFADCVLNLG